MDSLTLLAIDDSCDVNDRLNWNTEPDPGKWEGVIWDTPATRQVKELNLSYKSLAGRLYIGNLPALIYLHCAGNNINSLNVTGLTNLEYLDCTDNNLSVLNLNSLSHLYHLYCFANQLSELDVSSLSNLFFWV